jgi:hypothetical protein
MRLRRAPFTVRKLMLVVALAALSVWGVKLWGQSRYYLRLAQSYKYGEYLCRIQAALPGSAAQPPERAAQLLAEADHNAAMARKYERAARNPWLPVEPDSPEP